MLLSSILSFQREGPLLTLPAKQVWCWLSPSALVYLGMSLFLLNFWKSVFLDTSFSVSTIFFQLFEYILSFSLTYKLSAGKSIKSLMGPHVYVARHICLAVFKIVFDIWQFDYNVSLSTLFLNSSYLRFFGFHKSGCLSPCPPHQIYKKFIKQFLIK